jgi:Putative DNA-binding domain
MSKLAHLQRHFQNYVLHEPTGNAFDQSVVATEKASSVERLGVYSNAYTARLVEILGNDYLGLQALVGTDRFEEICRAYIEETPSHHYNARWYGDRLPAFLRLTSPWSEESSLHEMAQLDWMIGLSFDSPDETCATESDVAALAIDDWPEMVIRLSGTIRYANFSWNVADIHRALDLDKTRPKLRKHPEPQTWIVSRQDYVVRYRRLENDEAAAITAAHQGKSFGDLCEILCEWHSTDDVAMHAAVLLKAWIQNRWIASFALPK